MHHIRAFVPEPTESIGACHSFPRAVNLRKSLIQKEQFAPVEVTLAWPVSVRQRVL